MSVYLLDGNNNDADLFHVLYTRDAAGRITTYNSSQADQSYDYEYDYVGRLLFAHTMGTTDAAEAYTYDASGNMLSNASVGAYNGINRMRGYDQLTDRQRNELLNDPTNFQPLPGPLNCSKGCRAPRAPWETYRGQALDPEYSNWLLQEQRRLEGHFRERIQEMLGNR